MCHVVPEGWSTLFNVPHAGRLFHSAGHPDLRVHNDTVWLDELYDLNSRKSSQPDTDLLRAQMDAAKANLQVAQADFEQAVKWSVRGGFPPGQDPADMARAKVAQAKAQLEAAERELKQATAQAEEQSTEPHGQLDPASRGLGRVELERWLDATRPAPSDADFLRRVMLDLTGSPPTTVEEKYFVADRDPKKREKLLGILLGHSDKPAGRDRMIDELLADPEVQKRWAELQYQRAYREHLKAAREARAKNPGDRLDRLLADLMDKKKSDEQVLNALCLATLARFPTETEQKLILEAVKAQSDQMTAWRGVMAALSATDEARAHAAELGKHSGK
jgi:hypothetical protein